MTTFVSRPFALRLGAGVRSAQVHAAAYLHCCDIPRLQCSNLDLASIFGTLRCTQRRVGERREHMSQIRADNGDLV
jgi:hypothetical protein